MGLLKVGLGVFVLLTATAACNTEGGTNSVGDLCEETDQKAVECLEETLEEAIGFSCADVEASEDSAEGPCADALEAFFECVTDSTCEELDGDGRCGDEAEGLEENCEVAAV